MFNLFKNPYDYKLKKIKLFDFELSYKLKDEPLNEKTRSLHELGLSYHIYSPVRIRMLSEGYGDWYTKEDTPHEIQKLVQEAPSLSDSEIQAKLNKYYIHKAIRTMSAYKGGSVPLTNFPHVETKQINLLSQKGEQTLARLINAAKENDYSDRITLLALRGAHKFLMDTSCYRDFDIDGNFLIARHQMLEGPLKDKTFYTFPTVQLTKGCYNNCSHCMAEATADSINHMPYPMFIKIFEKLWPQYKKYPFYTGDHSFSKHFDDSDTFAYQDNIMGVDYGDVVTFLRAKHAAPSCLLTKGVRGKKAKLALAKTLQFSDWPINISFVDTPKENMPDNIKRLKDTLQVIKDIGFPKVLCLISHLTLKSGSSVPAEIFEDFKVEKVAIYNCGRALQFPKEELLITEDVGGYFIAPDVIQPNGDVVSRKVINGHIQSRKKANVFDTPFVFRQRSHWFWLTLHSRVRLRMLKKKFLNNKQHTKDN